MKNAGQGDNMKIYVEKNAPWPNAVSFLHQTLPSQMDTSCSDGCVCSTEEKSKNTEYISQACKQMSRLWLQVRRIIAIKKKNTLTVFMTQKQ